MSGALAVGADSSAFTKGTNLTSLTVINENQLGNTAQSVMIATLQGIVARHSGSQIYITGSSSGYGIWYPHLNKVYGIPYATTSDPWSLVAQFKNQVSGYLLYDAVSNSNSLNAATSLCGPFNAIAVDASLEATVRSYGITNCVADLRTRDEGWVWTNYNSRFSSNIVVEQKETLSDNLRDYAAMARSVYLFRWQLSVPRLHYEPDASRFGVPGMGRFVLWREHSCRQLLLQRRVHGRFRLGDGPVHAQQHPGPLVLPTHLHQRPPVGNQRALCDVHNHGRRQRAMGYR